MLTGRIPADSHQYFQLFIRLDLIAEELGDFDGNPTVRHYAITVSLPLTPGSSEQGSVVTLSNVGGRAQLRARRHVAG